jgi:uncharacterized membrane protein YkvA (DUF1232 family)
MSKDKKRLDEIRDAGAKPESETRVKRSFFDYFKKNNSKISFGKKIETLYAWMTSGHLSKRDKALVIGALLYFINPLDVIPDITPFLGFTDDLGVIYLVYNYLQNRSLEETDSNEEED